MVTLIARADPDLPCAAFLAPPEWKALPAAIDRLRDDAEN
jgi:hypothetical protein